MAQESNIFLAIISTDYSQLATLNHGNKGQ